MNEIPTFSKKGRENIEINNYIEIRPQVGAEAWRAFKSLTFLYGMEMRKALTEALKMWVNEVDKKEQVPHKCIKCKEVVNNKKYIIDIKDKERFYYCSFKCFSETQK